MCVKHKERWPKMASSSGFLGSTLLGSGPRGRGFESRHLDHFIKQGIFPRKSAFFFFFGFPFQEGS